MTEAFVRRPTLIRPFKRHSFLLKNRSDSVSFTQGYQAENTFFPWNFPLKQLSVLRVSAAANIYEWLCDTRVSLLRIISMCSFWRAFTTCEHAHMIAYCARCVCIYRPVEPGLLNNERYVLQHTIVNYSFVVQCTIFSNTHCSPLAPTIQYAASTLVTHQVSNPIFPRNTHY